MALAWHMIPDDSASKDETTSEKSTDTPTPTSDGTAGPAKPDEQTAADDGTSADAGSTAKARQSPKASAQKKNDAPTSRTKQSSDTHGDASIQDSTLGQPSDEATRKHEAPGSAPSNAPDSTPNDNTKRTLRRPDQEKAAAAKQSTAGRSRGEPASIIGLPATAWEGPHAD